MKAAGGGRGLLAADSWCDSLQRGCRGGGESGGAGCLDTGGTRNSHCTHSSGHTVAQFVVGFEASRARARGRSGLQGQQQQQALAAVGSARPDVLLPRAGGGAATFVTAPTMQHCLCWCQVHARACTLCPPRCAAAFCRGSHTFQELPAVHDTPLSRPHAAATEPASQPAGQPPTHLRIALMAPANSASDRLR